MHGLLGKQRALPCAQPDASDTGCAALDLELQATCERDQQLLPVVCGVPVHDLTPPEDHGARPQSACRRRDETPLTMVRRDSNSPRAAHPRSVTLMTRFHYT